MSGFGEAFERAFAYANEMPYANWSPWSPDGRTLLFAYPFDDDGALHIVPIDGSIPRDLGSGAFVFPSWSPDGSAILALGTRNLTDGPAGLLVMSPDGSSSRCIVTTFEPFLFAPAWSPDGHWIAYCTDTIELVRTDGSERRSLGTGWRPVWSPDGDRIAYSTEDRCADFGSITIASISGPDTTRLTNGICPSWSPDGDRLVFQDVWEGDEPPFAAFVIDADGSNRRRLCSGAFPRWSPRGDRILVQRIDDTLVTIAPDGSDERVLTEDARFGRWSPDGEWIAFQWQSSLHVVRADGTERRALALEQLARTAAP